MLNEKAKLKKAAPPNMKTQFHRIRLLVSILVASLVAAENGQAQTTAFNQGRLTDANNPANGPYDLRFQLFDTPAGQNAVSEFLPTSRVSVADGVFTVPLAFANATSVFNGADRWLEISVRPSGANSLEFTKLAPRQLLTPAPYALFALSAGPSGQGSTANGRFAFVGGGDRNIIQILGDYGTIGGGSQNVIGDHVTYATIAGGARNNSQGKSSVISGGEDNKINALLGVIGGGSGNNTSGESSVISGGKGNIIAAGDTTIGGGNGNKILTGIGATIAGGAANTIRGNYAVVGGGTDNNNSGISSTIAGGEHNGIQAS